MRTVKQVVETARGDTNHISCGVRDSFVLVVRLLQSGVAFAEQTSKRPQNVRDVWRDIEFDVRNGVGEMIDVCSEGTETAGMLDRLGFITFDVNACDAARMIEKLDDLDVKIAFKVHTMCSSCARSTPHGVSPVINLVEADGLRVDIISDAIRVPAIIEGSLRVCKTVKSLLPTILDHRKAVWEKFATAVESTLSTPRDGSARQFQRFKRPCLA